MAAGEEPTPLRFLELRLLRCSLPNDVVSHPYQPQASIKNCNNNEHSCHLLSLIEPLLQFIESGDYIHALQSDAVKLVFDFSEKPIDSAGRFYNELVMDRVDSFISSGGNEKDTGFRVFVVVAIAVAALFAFTQSNFTGPSERLPCMPLILMGLKEEDHDGDWVDWEVWARNQLMSTGSELCGKFLNLQYIVLAKMMLMRIKDRLSDESLLPFDGVQSIFWWLVRILVIQQKILDDHSSYLFNLLQVFMRESLHRFGTTGKVRSYWGSKFAEEEAQTIVSIIHLEMGVVEHTYGRVDSSNLYFKSAEEASGLQLSVSGAMGFRTVHQVEAKAQLVLVANTSSTNGGYMSPPSESIEFQKNISATSENNMLHHCGEMREASDTLLTPRLVDVDDETNSGTQKIQKGCVAVLKAIQQAVILAQCLSIEKSSRNNEMQRWEMAPYIEAIDSQPSSYFIIRCFCDILRIRWESSRSHTKERALLMMDKVVQGVQKSSPGVASRICCFFGVHIPSISALRKEYGDLLVSCGLIGEAVKIYEDLELWDNLIYCYCLLEKKSAAVELIRKRLAETPSDSRLWCSLGDVTNDDACYQKALEVSENRSARAKRSLARSAYNRGEYEKSKVLWESAMAQNSLFHDGWFALGAAALKARDVEKALVGFTRAVQLDPDNGEAWNNIACLHMIKKQYKESFIAFKEALKFKRNSWQLWENFSHVAADVDNFSQAIEAVQKVLDLTKNKKYDAGILERILIEVERRVLSSRPSTSVATVQDDCINDICADPDISSVVDMASSEVNFPRTRETDHLLEALGKILKQIVGSGGGAETWGLFARWHKLKGDLTMCSEALLKQVRSLQGSDLWKDGERFKKFAHASLELSKVYMELCSHTNSRRELLAAEMHLKNTVRQAEAFSDYQEFKDLQDCLIIVQTKLQDSLCPAA